MKKQTFGVMLAICCVFSAIGVSAQDIERIVGGYGSAATDEARVVAAAKFAVGSRAKTTKLKIKLGSVEKAEMQVVAGINYRLCLNISDGKKKQKVNAVVYQDLEQTYSLLSWELVKSCNVEETGENYVKHCAGEQLTLTAGDGESDMGRKRWGDYVFTNTSSTPCKLSGFPKLSLLDKTGKVLKSIAVKYGNGYLGANEEWKNLEAVMLEPGKKAAVQIYYNDGMARDQKKHFASVAKAQLIVTGDKKIFTIDSEFTVCCGVDVSSIHPYTEVFTENQ